MKKNLSEEQIDDLVVAQAEDPTAWNSPIQVEMDTSISLQLSPELAARAAFLSRLHHQSNVEEWLKAIVLERIRFEEGAFAALKNSLAAAQ